MLIFKILAFVFIVPGFLTVFLARSIVSKFNLADKVKCDFENEMNEEELKLYKQNKAVVNMKMFGMVVALPGIALIVFAYR